MTGKLYGIGVGPGDPELMTLKAVRIIKECDIIAVPGKCFQDSTAYQIASQAVPELMGKKVVGFHMPMTKEEQVLEAGYREHALCVMNWLEEGKQVGILTLGDVTIYSTYIYIHKLVSRAGYETEMVNGIPSFCAAAARLNIGLSERSQQLHILPASYQIEDGLKLDGTKVLMKIGSQFDKVKQQLKEAGQDAVMIENCGMEQEKIYNCLDEIKGQPGYYSLMIVNDMKKAVKK